MKKVEKLIVQNKLIVAGDIVGVAVSGGSDSMCLLAILQGLQSKLNFKLVAINIDHSLRENSKQDSAFVKNYCDKNNIKLFSYVIDVNKICAEKKYTIEQGAREGRYKIFKKLLDRGDVTKIALGHHMQDQAETILLNIFRGCSLNGASGMELIRDGAYIRPLLTTQKTEIKAYVNNNEIPFVEDETNMQNDYARNYIRNMIMPMIRNKWASADASICKFGDTCKQDDDYILSQIDESAIMLEGEGIAKISINYFIQSPAIVNRLIMKAIKLIGITTNIENKHLYIIRSMAIESENGSKISLPNGISVIKEYNFITITNRKLKPKQKSWKLEKGVFDIPNFGVLEVHLTRKFDLHVYQNLFDVKKAPKTAVWRFKKEGDMFEKFGGGRKTLNEFLIDKKVPQRIRNFIPVLADGNEVLVVAGLEISPKLKVDDNTKSAYGINLVRLK